MEAFYDVWPYWSVGGQLGGVVGPPQPPLAQLLFLPGRYIQKITNLSRILTL